MNRIKPARLRQLVFGFYMSGGFPVGDLHSPYCDETHRSDFGSA